MEATSHIVRVEQSQADRRKMPFDPVKYVSSCLISFLISKHYLI